MGDTEVDCPYCGTGNSVTVPDGSEPKDPVQTYKTGQWGRDKLVEVSCSGDHTFGVPYK